MIFVVRYASGSGMQVMKLAQVESAFFYDGMAFLIDKVTGDNLREVHDLGFDFQNHNGDGV